MTNSDIERDPDEEGLYVLTIRRDDIDPHWVRAAETPAHAVEILNNKFSFDIPAFGEKIEKGEFLDDSRGTLVGWLKRGDGTVPPFPITYKLVWWPEKGRYARYDIELKVQDTRVDR